MANHFANAVTRLGNFFGKKRRRHNPYVVYACRQASSLAGQSGFAMRQHAARGRPRPMPACLPDSIILSCGEVAERSKAPHSKCGVPATVPWVRIPPSPPRTNLTSQLSVTIRATAGLLSLMRMLLGHVKVTSVYKALYRHPQSYAGHAEPAASTRLRWAKDWTEIFMYKSTLRNLSFGIVVACLSGPAFAYQAASAPPANAPAANRSGQQDFDFELGTWATKVRVLRNPLSGSVPIWAEYQGTSIIRPLMGGRANVVELSLEGAAGKIEGVSLRLYSPKSSQWSLNFAGLRNGLLTAPVYGSFDGRGHGTFYGQDMLEGRAITVRFVISQISPNEARFVQSYSADGGASWEVNWVAVDTRLDGG